MSFAHKVVAWVMQQQGYLTLPYLRGPLGYQLLTLPCATLAKERDYLFIL